MYLSRNIQTFILNILYEYDEIWSSQFYLVNKHFFTVCKSLIGSQLNFIIDSRKDEIKLQSFVNFVTSTDRLYNKPYFLYEQLVKLTICILERNKEHILFQYCDEFTIMSITISALLKSKQWKKWNKELIKSTRNHGIDVQVIDPYYYLGLNSFENFHESDQVRHLDICIDLELEQSTPPPNLQTLNLSTYDIGHGDPENTYDRLIDDTTEICKHITKLSLASYRFSIEKWMNLLDSIGGQLTRLEIVKIYTEDGDCSDFIHFLNEHSNIKEFGITEGYSQLGTNPLVQMIVDYLFSDKCHIETITQVNFHSNSIPPIKRRIPYMLASLRMITAFDINSRKENADINKEELKQQIDKAIIEFSNIDHLVLCYCNKENDYFLIDDFVTLANAVKDYNSTLNKKVEIYYRNLKYQLLHHDDVKGLSRRIIKYKTIGRYNIKDGNESY